MDDKFNQWLINKHGKSDGFTPLELNVFYSLYKIESFDTEIAELQRRINELESK
jgi:hypothetical protein